MCLRRGFASKDALAIHKARKRQVRPNSGNELIWKQEDSSYRWFISVLNEDRQAKGLPPIEM